MKELEEKLNNVLGYLTAMSFANPNQANELELPLNELSEAVELVNNFVLDIVVESACSDYEEGINMQCSRCDQSMHLHK